MAAPSQDVATKVSTEVAENFIQTFYPALQSARPTIATFYLSPTATPDGKALPAILFNGNIIPNPAALQTMFQQDVPAAHYEVQSFDCQVLNPSHTAENTQFDSRAAVIGKKMTLLLGVNGYVRLGEPRDADMRGFSDTFVLVPNPAMATAGRGKTSKEWVIQSQNFRLVV